MRVIDRFDLYMKEKGLNDNRVTVQLGLSVGSIGKSRKEGRDLSKKAVAKILAYYNDLDETWLLTGNGEMLCEPRVKEEEQKPTQEEKNLQPVQPLRNLLMVSAVRKPSLKNWWVKSPNHTTLSLSSKNRWIVFLRCWKQKKWTRANWRKFSERNTRVH